MLQTYTHSHTVAGSAASATAFLAGVKTTNGLLGFNHHQPLKKCNNADFEKNKVYSIMRWAQLAGVWA